MKWYWWLLFVPLLGNGAEIPSLILPQGVGVNIHFVSGHEADLDLIQAGGFKFIRMDFSWEGTEKRKGEYDWTDYDQLVADLEKRALRPVFILDYSHPLYETSVTSPNPLNQQPRTTVAAPQHPESIAAYARWATAAALHFHGHHVIWEIWNEPNIQFWAPKPDADQYAALALATARAIRLAEPSATIVGPASSGFPWQFLETFLKSGVLEYLDAVSVHPYRDYKRSPETAGDDYRKLRELINRYAPESRKGKIPVLSGEWGYATHTKGLPLQTQAAFAARQQLANILFEVPLSIWYDWMNDGPDPDEREHNFGTVRSDLQPKPAYLAIQTLTRNLNGLHLAKRLPLESDQDFVLLFDDASGNQKLAAWTAGEPHLVRVKAGLKQGRQFNAKTWDGQSFNPKVEGEALVLELSAGPQYVELKKRAAIK